MIIDFFVYQFFRKEYSIQQSTYTLQISLKLESKVSLLLYLCGFWDRNWISIKYLRTFLDLKLYQGKLAISVPTAALSSISLVPKYENINKLLSILTIIMTIFIKTVLSPNNYKMWKCNEIKFNWIIKQEVES